MEIKCKLKALQPVVEKGNFKSRKVWVITEENPTYPQVIEIELQQDKVTMMDGINIGAPLKLQLNLRGREWAGTDGVTKVFNSLVCWKVEADGIAPGTPVANNAMAAASTELPNLDEGEKLPF